MGQQHELVDAILPALGAEKPFDGYGYRGWLLCRDLTLSELEDSGNATTKAPKTSRTHKTTKNRSELSIKEIADSKLTTFLAIS